MREKQINKISLHSLRGGSTISYLGFCQKEKMREGERRRTSGWFTIILEKRSREGNVTIANTLWIWGMGDQHLESDYRTLEKI